MVYGAIDLHLRYSYVRIIDADGRVLRQQRVATTRERFVAVCAGFDALRVLVEASTESEWVAQALEAAGHTVIVADPNFAPMYGEVRRTVKTDVRDVTALAEANRQGWYRRAHRVSAEQQRRRQALGARRHLVQLRTGTISVIRATLRQRGYRVGSGSSATLVRRVERLTVPPALAEILQPLLATVTALTTQIRSYEVRFVAEAATDPVVSRLQTAPGIGTIVALSYRAFVDDVRRFRSAAHVSAAMGLVPREHSSAERRHRGHLTKVGPPELRSLMVQAAWSYWRTVRSGPLRAWVDGVAARRGKRIAVVALARRLSRILFALWRDETVFTDSRVTA